MLPVYYSLARRAVYPTDSVADDGLQKRSHGDHLPHLRNTELRTVPSSCMCTLCCSTSRQSIQGRHLFEDARLCQKACASADLAMQEKAHM